MDDWKLADLACLTTAQKQVLDKAKILKASDLLIKRVTEVAKKCKMKTDEMERLIDSVCQELYQSPRTIREMYRLGEEVFTTGEPYMDEALGGGIRTGMLWEIAGEKNAGKTQLALQLCLTVQLPPNEGGLYGAAYYISTRDEPQVSERLRQMIERHPRLSPHSCTLPPHCTISTFPAFRDALRESIPKYAEELCASTPGRKRLKLVIVDAISDLFDANKVPEYEDTKWRARHLRLTSSLLHQLATDSHVAVIVLGGTRGTFPRKDGEDKSPGELRYSDQERWFARGYSLDGEDANEAILGHVWPNQLNARIMMSRTARERPRHALDPKARKLRVPEPASKCRRLDPDAPHQQSTCEDAEDERLPLRRFSVLFSSAGHAASCDYAILDGGVIGFPPEERPQSTPEKWPATLPPTAGDPSLMYDGSLSTSSAELGASRSPWYQQSLSYVTDPGRQVTPPPSTGQGMLVDDEDDEEAYWGHFN